MVHVTPRGAPLLVKLVRWRFPDDGAGKDFFRQLDAEAFLQQLREHRKVPEHTAAELRERWKFSDTVVAVLGADFAFRNPLLDSKRQLSVSRMRDAQNQAAKIIGALIELSRQKPPWPSTRVRRPFAGVVAEYPQLAVLQRTLRYRFVPPQVWHKSSAPMVAQRSIWHPVLRTLDDFLTWATADVLSTESADRLGQCDYCKRYYYSKREKHHRFCPDTDCRDLYWREKSGTERVRRSQEKHGRRKATARSEQAIDVHGTRADAATGETTAMPANASSTTTANTATDPRMAPTTTPTPVPRTHPQGTLGDGDADDD